MYDIVAARYGYTIIQFYALTLRQIVALIKTVDWGRHRELEVDAKLHGMKVKPWVEAKKVSPKVKADQDKQAKDAFERLKKRHAERQRTDNKNRR